MNENKPLLTYAVVIRAEFKNIQELNNVLLDMRGIKIIYSKIKAGKLMVVDDDE